MATIAQTDETGETTGGATVTFLAQAVGADGGQDIVYLTIGWRTVSSANLTSVTVDGETASIVVSDRRDDGGGIFSGAAIAAIERNSLPDPSQTDVDVVLGYSASTIRNILGVWISPDATAIATDTTTATTNPVATLSVDTEANGIGLAICYAGDITTGYTWVGLTEVNDVQLPGPNWWSTAAGSNLSASTPLTVTATQAASTTQVGVCASFPAFSAPGTIEFADSDTWVVGSSDTATFTLTLPSVFGGDESIYVSAGARTTSGLLSSVAVEIDGEPVPKVKEFTIDEGSGISSVAGIYAIKRDDLPTPGATSITLTCQYNVTLLRGAASIYVGQATQITPHDDDFGTTGTGDTSLSVPLSVHVPTGGITIGAAYIGLPNDGATSASWTGVTEDTDLLLVAGPNIWTSASLESLAEEDPLAITVNIASPGSMVALAVSFPLESDPVEQIGPELLEFRGQRTSTTGGTAATMVLPIAAREGGNEAIYVALGARSISGFPTVSSLTFDGVEGTLLVLPVQSGEGLSATSTVIIYGIRRQDLPNPLVETVTMEVTYSVSTLRSGAMVWVGQGLDLEPLGVGADIGGLTPETLSTTITIPLLGATIGFYYSGEGWGGGGFDWTGIEHRSSVEIAGPNAFSGAMELIGAEGTLRTITATKEQAPDGCLVAFSVLQRVPDVIIPPGAPAIPFELFFRQGGPNQIPLQGDSWTAGEVFDIPDDGPVRDPIQPGVNSPRIKGIGWRRAMWRLRQAKGFM